MPIFFPLAVAAIIPIIRVVINRKKVEACRFSRQSSVCKVASDHTCAPFAFSRHSSVREVAADHTRTPFSFSRHPSVREAAADHTCSRCLVSSLGKQVDQVPRIIGAWVGILVYLMCRLLSILREGGRISKSSRRMVGDELEPQSTCGPLQVVWNGCASVCRLNPMVFSPTTLLAGAAATMELV